MRNVRDDFGTGRVIFDIVPFQVYHIVDDEVYWKIRQEIGAIDLALRDQV